MTDLTEMWEALGQYQPYADKHGFGEEWRRMCKERTESAAWAAAWAAAKDAAEAAAEAAAAFAAAEAAEAACLAFAEKAAEWKKYAITYIRKAIAKEQT